MNEITFVLSFAAPTHDERFVRLPDAPRNMVMARQAAMQRIHGSVKKEEAIKLIASERRDQRGWGKGTVRNLWYQFLLKRGDWTVLLDKSMAGPAWWGNMEGVALPEGFVDHLGDIWALRQRGKFRAAWVDLLAQWRRWRKGGTKADIPGYTHCPAPEPGTDLPSGWSYRNLQRVAKTSASSYARKLIQIGPKAAQEQTYKIPTTRVGLAPGQIYDFDDQENDFRVLYRGKGSRILSLHAHDIASDCVVLSGHKPTVENDAGFKEKLKEREMVYLLAALFMRIGFDPHG
jgi:hypothetical protein